MKARCRRLEYARIQLTFSELPVYQTPLPDVVGSPSPNCATFIIDLSESEATGLQDALEKKGSTMILSISKGRKGGEGTQKDNTDPLGPDLVRKAIGQLR